MMRETNYIFEFFSQQLSLLHYLLFLVYWENSRFVEIDQKVITGKCQNVLNFW